MSGSRLEKSLLKELRIQKKVMPDFIAPQLATRVDHPPSHEGWIHEIKFDGYRILSKIEKKKIDLYSRNNKVWTEKFAQIAEAMETVEANQAWIDGEITILTPSGKTDFQALQNRLRHTGKGEFVYFVFDIMYLDGYDLRSIPLIQRKEILKSVLGDHEMIRFSDHITGEGDEVFSRACHMHLEGIVSKRMEGLYISGRGLNWVKSKCIGRDEFVIVGFTKLKKNLDEMGSLLLGYFDDKGHLIYSGKVGTGFSHRDRKEMYTTLNKIRKQSQKIRAAIPQSELRHAIWVQPKLVAEIEFTEWTKDGLLRHPSFLGIRQDKRAKDVRKEDAVSVRI